MRIPSFVFVVGWALAAPVAVAAKDMIPTPPETPVLGELEPVLARAMLAEGGADESLATVLGRADVRAQIEKHELRLFGGPMVGCVDHRSAKVWLRTAGPAEVEVAVADGPAVRAQTTRSNDFTTVLSLDGLEAATTYRYSVTVDGRNPLDFEPGFRTAPTPGQGAVLRFAFGGGARYNPPAERIWDTVAAQRPDGFLWLGDNLYQDAPENRSLQRLYYYRRQLRPEFQRLTAQCGNYAIWDDHDFGKNDCAGGPDPFVPAWKVPVWKVFRENWVNPGYGGGAARPGCWFRWRCGDVEMFMTDGRYYRDFKHGSMLGPDQKKWLKTALADSDAPFKVLASGTLWTEHADKGGKDSWWGVKEEREEIFGWIEERKIDGVVLVSADRHRHEMFRIERPRGYDLWEFETSKLTNIHTHGPNKHAEFSYNKGNFFGLLTFDTTVADPTVTFAGITIDGETFHEHSLRLSELRHPRE